MWKTYDYGQAASAETGVVNKAYVGGLILPQDEHVMWEQSRLRPGDELRVKIVEAEAGDKPQNAFQATISPTKKEKMLCATNG